MTKPSAKTRAVTKHDSVLGMLRAKRGATIFAISEATGWQPHSVRAFLTAVVKRKLGLSLISEKTRLGRVYRVSTNKVSVTPRAETTRERSRA